MKRTVFTILALVAMLSTMSIAAVAQPKPLAWSVGVEKSASCNDDGTWHYSVSISPDPEYDHLGLRVITEGDDLSGDTSQQNGSKNVNFVVKWQHYSLVHHKWVTDEQKNVHVTINQPDDCNPPYQACDEITKLDKEYGQTVDVGQPHDWTKWTDNGDGTLSRTGIQDTETPWIQRYVDKRDDETPCGGERGVDKSTRRLTQTKDKGDPTFSVNMVCDRAVGGDVYQAIIMFTLGDGARGITVDGKSFGSSGHKYVGFGKYSYTIHGDAQYNDATGTVKVTHEDCLNDLSTVDLGGPVDPLAGVLGGVALIALLGAGGLALRKRSA